MLDKRVEFQELINNLEVGIFRYSLDSKGQFLFTNAAFARMLNHSSTDLRKMNFQEICENADELSRVNTKICSEGLVKSEWIKLRKKDGQSIQCSMTAALSRDKEGKEL